MQQKFLALGDDFTIRDETGRDAFFVDGKTFSIGDQLSFQERSQPYPSSGAPGPTHTVSRSEKARTTC
jgi:hypothetical protein